MARYELECGVRRAPVKALVYGHEGIGKSTLAAQMPSPAFIDVEGGTNQLPVARLPRPTSWEMLLDEVRAVRDGDVPCSTLVVDTADAAERLCMAHACAKAGWKNIEEPGYGKGYVVVRDEMGRLLDALTEVVEGGRNVVLLCHSILSKFERPDESGAYDRWSLKLVDSKRTSVAALCKEWADMVLFCDYKIYVTTDKSGKNGKAAGGARVIRTTHHPCWDAKNRFGLPDELPMPFGEMPRELAEVIPDMAVAVPPQPHPTNAAQPAASPAAAPGAGPADGMSASELDAMIAGMEADVERAMPPQATTRPYERPGYPARMRALEDLMARDFVTDAELRHAVGQTGNFPESCAATDYEQDFVDYLVSGWGRMLDRIRTNRIPVPFDEEGE